MAAIFEKTKLQEDESFSIGVFQDNHENIGWHYHNNFEISFITEGAGKRIVADSMEDFQPGDLAFIGPNLPHVWLSNKDVSSFTRRSLEMVFLQFTDEVLPPELLLLPEFRNIAKALQLSERGIQIVGQTLNEVSEIMLQMPFLKGLDRMMYFYQLLNIIGKSTSNIQLASNEYLNKKFKSGNKRLMDIHNYFMHNYREDVDLKNLAALVNMAEGSLCRFFKQNMGITIFEYLNKIKIDFACKLLMDPDLSITEVSFDSGFNNLSHFNRQFKRVTGLQPTEYRRKYYEVIRYSKT